MFNVPEYGKISFWQWLTSSRATRAAWVLARKRHVAKYGPVPQWVLNRKRTP